MRRIAAETTATSEPLSPTPPPQNMQQASELVLEMMRKRKCRKMKLKVKARVKRKHLPWLWTMKKMMGRTMTRPAVMRIVSKSK